MEVARKPIPKAYFDNNKKITKMLKKTNIALGFKNLI